MCATTPYHTQQRKGSCTKARRATSFHVPRRLQWLQMYEKHAKQLIRCLSEVLPLRLDITEVTVLQAKSTENREVSDDLK